MRRFIMIGLAVSLGLLSGCAYERVKIVAGYQELDGLILSDFRDVELRSGSILLKPGARLAIHAPDIADFASGFDLMVTSGEGAIIYVRSVPHDFDSTTGIAFRYAVDGCSVRLPMSDPVPLGSPASGKLQRISITSLARRLSIAVDCDPPALYHTLLPATEYVILEALPGSTVELRSVSFRRAPGP